MAKYHLLVLALAVYSRRAFCEDLRIRSASEFIALSNSVNSGTNYNGTTVFLDNDIDFSGGLSEQFDPIGNGYTNSFRGTFDGQGHTISNLEIKSSSEYTGLLGYISGAAIRNIVLDSSCSVMSSCTGSWSYVGTVTGNCDGCTIENNVNMGSVSFIDKSTRTLYLGGIVGETDSTFTGATVVIRNCANYGSVTHSGTANNAYIGGVVGGSGFSQNKGHVQNCLNYGTIMHYRKTSSDLYIGGILGYASGTNLDNCVNVGIVLSSTTSDYIGSVVGYVGSTGAITHCYSVSGTTYRKAYGGGYPTLLKITSFNSTTFELNETISVGDYTGTSLIDALNAAADYYYLRDYSHWLLNKDTKPISFTINNNRTKPLTLNSQLILLPDLANEGKLWFDGWYTDSSCTAPLTSHDISTNTALFGKWEENNNYYTITFDTRGSAPVPEPVSAQYGAVVTLPSVSTSRCTLLWWEDDRGNKVSFNFTVPAHDITLNAVWPCKYIKTAEDLIDFSKVVNSGTSYSGTTVFLDNDIDFSGDGLSEQFNPIGNDIISNYFQGTFNGQGHTISNLAINSSFQYTGLFGYARDAIIRNVVLDSSCSVVGSYTGSSSYVGGIAGYCYDCTIENDVNIASAIFTGTITSYSIHIGGVVGELYSSGNEVAVVRNCANYGSVTHSGTASSAYIGGVTGRSYGSSSGKAFIQNCLNYGAITHNEAISNSFYIGGVIGNG